MEVYAIAEIYLRYNIIFICFIYMPKCVETRAENERSKNVRNGTRIFTQNFLEPINMVWKLAYE